MMSLPGSPSRGHLVTLDFETAGVNLASVPLDDILGFREDHGEAYRAYARNVRRQVNELGAMEPEERETVLLDRREELTDLASDLRKTARHFWPKQLGAFTLAAAGASWVAQHGHDPIGATLMAAAAAAALVGAVPEQPVTAYSYVFSAKRELRIPSG